MNRPLLFGLLACGLAFAASAAAVGGVDHGQQPPVESGVEESPPDLAFDERSEPDLGRLRLALSRPDSFLPQRISPADQAAVIVTDLLYDGLTEAVGLEGRLRPGLATGWEPSTDFTEWTFDLDERRIHADEVVAHFEEAVLEGTNPTTALLLGDIVSIEPLAADQVRFVLGAPNAGFAWLLSGTGASIAGPDGRGTSHYTIERNDADMLVLVPDDDDDAAAGWPTIEVTWVGDDNHAYETLSLGLVDAAVAPAEALDDARTRFGSAPPARAISRFYGLNLDSPLFDDERLVAAVLHAVDRRELVGGGAFVVDGVVAPSTAGYVAGACAAACSYDPERSAELVRSVVGKDGEPDVEGEAQTVTPEIMISVAGEDQVTVAEGLASYLDDAGFAAMVGVETPAGLADRLADEEVDLFAFGWMAGAGSIDAVVPPLLASEGVANVLGFDVPAVDELIDEARRTGDDPARWALLAEAHRLAMGEGRVLPLAVAKSGLITAPQASALVVRADGSIDIEASE